MFTATSGLFSRRVEHWSNWPCDTGQYGFRAGSVIVWINDGHTVVAALEGRTPTWGWRCPYRDDALPDPLPCCRQPPRRHTQGCAVAPWFMEEGIARCLFPAGRILLPQVKPILAEYAWFGGHYRWRPVQ